MSKTNDGGSAYPSTSWTRDGDFLGDNQGMTLRDYFAAKAMQAVPMQQGHLHDVPAAYDRIASHAYKMADAMLRAREAA